MAEDNIVGDAHNSQTRVLLLDISPWLASFLYEVFTFLLVFGVFAVFVGLFWTIGGLSFVGAFTSALGTWGSIRFGAAKEHFASERISANELSTAEANARAAEANKEIIRLKSQRTFTEATAARFIHSMQRFSGRDITVGAVPQTFESLAFADQLFRAFRAAGLNPRFNQGAAELHVGPVRGVVAVSVTGNSRGEELARGFVDAMQPTFIEVGWSGGLLEALINTAPGNTLTNPTKVQRELTDRQSKYHEWVIIVVGDKSWSQ